MTPSNEAAVWVVAGTSGVATAAIVSAFDRLPVVAVVAILALVAAAFGVCTMLWRDGEARAAKRS